jgi:hypothetical protein
MPDPRAGDIDHCAITMALNAHGAVPDPRDALYPHKNAECSGDEGDAEGEGGSAMPVRPEETVSANWFQALRSHEALAQIYSWIDKGFPCRWCGKELRGTAIVYHPFDEHVMRGGVTIDELCSWIASIEPAAECYGVTLDIGLGVRFASEWEKKSVLQAAAEAGLSANAYVAAAVRLVLESQMPVNGFERADPLIGRQQDVNYAPHRENA